MEVCDENSNLSQNGPMHQSSTDANAATNSSGELLPLQKEAEHLQCDNSLMSCGNEEKQDNDSDNDDDDDNLDLSENSSAGESEILTAEDGDEDDTFDQYEDVSEIQHDDDDDDDVANIKSNDCDLAKMYLTDIEIDSKEEQQTITDLVNATQDKQLLPR